MASSPISRRSASASPPPARIRKTNRFLTMEESSDEEEDEEILRPRGKMAARMLVRRDTRPESDSEPQADDDARQNEESQPMSTQAKKDGEEEDEEDEILRPRPRKLMARRQRSTTPESATLSPEKSAPASPGLFVSPSKPTDDINNHDEDADMPSLTSLVKNPRYMALIEEKRQKRLALESEETRRKAERQQAMAAERMSIDDDEDDDSITDDEGGRKLTQEASNSRPGRKASKKALEEMNRETQRMTRNLQLAHEAKVKKKLTKASLFERFNFKPQGAAGQEPPQEVPAPASSSRAATPASIQQSDAEMKDGETPPSSPPAAEGEKVAPVPQTIDDDNDNLPTLEELAVTATAQKKLDKGKAKATEADFAAEDKAKEKLPRVKRNLRVKFPNPPVQSNATIMSLDDEDDLEIAKPSRSSKIDAIFSRINPQQKKEPHALSNLRKLAMLDDPEKKAGPVPTKTRQRSAEQKPAMTVGELQVTLLQKARTQAKLERDRHLEMLRAKGVHMQTAEEREKEMQQVDDIVARARKEAEEIMERERAAAKKERKENGEDPLDWDDSDYDGESVDEEGVEVEEAEFDLSGSEEEADDGEEEVEGDKLVDDAAEDAEESADEDPAEEDGGAALSGDDDELPTLKQTRRKARVTTAVLSDDENDDEPVVKATPRHKATATKSPSVQKSDSPVIPTSVLRSATKTFIPGLPVPLAGPAGLGLTQIFQGTMDESEIGSPLPTPSQPRPTFDPDVFPDSNFSQTAREDAEDLILNTQPQPTQNAETQGIQIRFSQSQVHGFDSMLRENFDATQYSELLEPTQDTGFKNYTPLKDPLVNAPTSTIETLPVEVSQVAESPLVRRTGKLRRRAEVAVSDAEDDEPTENLEEDEFGFGTVSNSNNAFTAMREAARKEKERKRKEAFDRKKSKAKEMVQEQAEESEDEYAGLGGADGEDSHDEANESDKEMIDDDTKDTSVDERKLAAFYADRERASDEKQVEKLFHDITTGMLRRKRAGNWDDLSDSDDGGEARRRMKRRQFAKMQRALFADERISKVAENPRNQAFLRTIEDHGSDDDMDFIFAPPPPTPGMESQDSQSSASNKDAAVIIPNSQPTEQAPTAPMASNNPRRTGISTKKPSNLGEIRESLSNLLDEPSYNSSSVIPATELGSDSEDDAAAGQNEEETIASSNSSNKENVPSNPRRTRHSQTSQIVDRISLKRQSSSTTTVATSSKLAFTSTTIDKRGFKVPALLRRATTNSSSSTTTTSFGGGAVSSTGVTASNGPSRPSALGRQDDGMKIKKNAGKKSGVSYLARGNERQAALADSEKRREAKKFKGLLAEGRQNVVKGLLGGGRFE
ncbi:MRC1-like domain-containing protein [Podospora fimiseda]|uniref:MRC1-like domain-containing protein n=1 Tax=Podospora fimiseda TaxID=252190 RepID=A0AAN7BU61_9PEZI|nr:MRC1-like domain-containing protein [Podospora fimiseda]